jgi:AcrR family transcriptional regulator
VTTSAPTARASRPRAARGETRRRLLAAALDHFSRRPYEEVTVAEIAESAEVAHGLLFHYFQNKRGLYLEGLREAVRQLTVAHETDPGQPPGRQLRQLLAAHLRHLSEHEQLALSLILRVGDDPQAWEAFEATRWDSIDWACGLLGLDPGRPALRLMWRSFAGAADEATVLWLKNGRPFEVEAFVEALVEMLVGALRGAARLDPGLDVGRAVVELGSP